MGTCSCSHKSCSFIIYTFDGNIFWPVRWKSVLSQEDIRKVCLIKIKSKLWRYIMIQYDTGKVFFWKVNFSYFKNFLEGSTFLVVPFRLVQFMDFKKLQAQFCVSSRPPRNPFNIPENENKNHNVAQLKLLTTYLCLLSLYRGFFWIASKLFSLWNNERNFDLKDAKSLSRSFAFTTLVPMTMTILLEITILQCFRQKIWWTHLNKSLVMSTLL